MRAASMARPSATTRRIAAALQATVVLLLGSASTLAAAQAAPGDVRVKLGVNQISPVVRSGELSPPSLPNSTIDVGEATSVIVTAAYQVDARLSVEFFAGLPYEHSITGDGALAGIGKIGSVKQVSPTVLAQYRFDAMGAVTPYVGAGLTVAHFYGTRGSNVLTATTNPGGPPTELKVKDTAGPTVQAGLSLALDKGWFVDVAVLKTWIKARTELSTGQTLSARLDPVSFAISVGCTF